MKKTIVALSIFCALGTLAYAGPEAFSGKEMKQVAPPPPPACPNWTGFYIGGFGGYKFSSVETDLSLGGFWNTVFPNGRDAVEAHAPRDLDNSGGEAGGLIGYNYQWQNWVFGLEATGGYLWARDSKDAVFDIPNEAPYEVATSFKTHYLVTVAPRVGYAFCRWLPYITGGLAVGDLDYSQRIENVGASRQQFTFQESGSESEMNAGWMVGGGLEYSLTDRWHLRGQYQFIDLGSVDFATRATNPGFTGHHEANLREHNVSFAIIYGF